MGDHEFEPGDHIYSGGMWLCTCTKTKQKIMSSKLFFGFVWEFGGERKEGIWGDKNIE